MAKWIDFLFGSKPKIEERSLLSPEQQQLFGSLTEGLQGPQQAGLDYLMQLLSGDEEAFEAFSAPEMRRFQEEILPMIAERFAGLGALNSSGFQQAGVKAGESLAEKLGALRAQQKGGALQSLSGFTGQALSPKKQFYQTGGSPGALPGILEGGARGLAALYGGM